MSANVIDSFLVGLGFEIDGTGLDKFLEKVKEAEFFMLAVGTAAATAAAGIGAFTVKIADEMDELGDFAELNKVSAAAVEEFGYAAKLNGSSLDAVKSSVAGVNDTIGQAVLGLGRGAKTFEKLDLSARNADGSVKSFDQILEDVSGKMQGLSRQENIAMARKLGIDESLVPLLEKGTDAIRAYRDEARELGGMEDVDYQAAGALMDTIDRTRFAVGALTTRIAVGLMPMVTRVVDGFLEWFKANRRVIQSGIERFLEVVTNVIGFVWRIAVFLAGTIDRVAEAFGGWNNVLRITTVLLGLMLAKNVGGWIIGMVGAVGKLMTGFRGLLTVLSGFAIWPALIGATAIAIALLIDDLMTFREGGESVIGDLVKQFPQLLPVINTITDAIGGFFSYLGDLWEALRPSLIELGQALIGLFQNAWPIIKAVLELFGRLALFLLPLILKGIGGLVRVLAGVLDAVTNILTTIINAAAKVVGWVSKAAAFLGLTDKTPDTKRAVAESQIPQKATSPYAVAAMSYGPAAYGIKPSTSTSTTNTQVSVGGITVVSPDPDKAGVAVRDELSKINRTSIRNGQSAVKL